MNRRQSLTASLLLLAIAACGQPEPAREPTFHEVMIGMIDPIADVIWKVSSKSYGPDGNAQPGLLTDNDWSEIAKSARILHDGATIIAENPNIEVVRPGVKILDEGVVAEAVTAAQVVAYIDHDRPGLARHARDLSKIALQIEAAAKARDAHATVRLAEELDYVCEACHQRFWYPEQPALTGAKGNPALSGGAP